MLLRLFTIPLLGALLGALLLGFAVWVFAPHLGEAFDGTWLRWLLAALPLLGWLVVALLLARRAQRREAGIAAAIAPEDSAADLAAARGAEEEARLREKLIAAMAELKQGGTALYELPWYVLIGPPGSGKTTALTHSGLDFPLAEGAKLAGVGGTRDCDWWIANEAVLLDTAGRYTTQDSEAAADKAGWERFLALLKQHRPRMPLNGVLVAFGVDRIARLDAAERGAHARAVRKRVRELEQRLGQRLPVYLLVSKADLLPGFCEFFDDLDKAGREQVWGMTFPTALPMEGAPALFSAEFAALGERLQARLFERLRAERGAAQRAAIAGFPAQFAALQEPLAAFLAAAFGGSRLEPAPLLRGVYLTSGTQEGTPLDRLAGALSRGFGLSAARPAAVMGRKGRAYFLGLLLGEVIFGEARLASPERGTVKRRRLIQAGAWAAALLAVLGGGAWAYRAAGTEQARAERLAARIAQAEAATAGIEMQRITDPELARALGYLEAARALPEAARGEGSLGFSQEERLTSEAGFAYRRALERVLLPRLLARLETQLRTGMHRPDFLYEATRVYLMLGRQGPLDRALVREWFALDWTQAFPGAVNQPGREALARHLDALLAADFAAYPLDGALVDQARRVLSRLPLAERVYARWRPMAHDVAPWRPADALGAAGARYFARASGQPLSEGVPGAFTVEGLHRTLLPRLPQAVLEAASEAWVLGPEAARAGAGDPRALEAAVLALYAREYGDAWQRLLDDLQLPAFRDLKTAAEALNLLGAPNSPMRDLMRRIARQLSPGTAPEPPAQAAGAAAPAQGAASAAARTADAADRLAAAFGGFQPSGAEPVARIVEERFRPLREAAGAPMDEILRAVSELYVQVARLANSPPGTVLPPTPGLDPGQRLLAEAARQPQPLARWLASLGQSTQRARLGGARAAIATAGAQQLAPLCRGIETRFPFRRTAAAPDMPMDDFVRLLSPGGVLDSFFTQNIRPYADITQNPWRPVAADGLEPPVSQADLIQFQRAAVLRHAFFPSGSPGIGLGLRWNLQPAGLAPGFSQAVLEAEGARNAIGPGGPGRPVELVWPARAPVALSFQAPPAPGQPPAQLAAPLSHEGAWAALRFVFLGQIATTPQPDRFRLRVAGGGGAAEFWVITGSAVNPFGLLRELDAFRCPALPPPPATP